MSRRRKATPGTIEYLAMELRATNDGSAGFSGHLSHFGSVDGYGTVFTRGAFRKTIAEQGGRIPILWQHFPEYPIGKPTELREDKVGLFANVEIVEDTEKGSEAMALLRADVPLGLSFGFRRVKDRPIADNDVFDFSKAPEWFKSKEGRADVRVVTEVALKEGSIVTFPGNKNVDFTDVRSAAELEMLESILNALESGSLRDSHEEPIRQIVEAYQTRSEPEPPSTPGTSLTDTEAERRNRDLRARFALINAAAILQG